MGEDAIERMYAQEVAKHSPENLEHLKDGLAQLSDEILRDTCQYSEQKNLTIARRSLGRFYNSQADYHCLLAVLSHFKEDETGRQDNFKLAHMFYDLGKQTQPSE